VTRLLMGAAIAALRLAHNAAMRKYRSSKDDQWRRIALGLIYAETLVRIERFRMLGY